ncbi:hypothetical protein HK101_002380 [Irineochytrium annulatum]|nr:hypothetical protein HK101_002380 [Irineochytrium annulatum]
MIVTEEHKMPQAAERLHAEQRKNMKPHSTDEKPLDLHLAKDPSPETLADLSGNVEGQPAANKSCTKDFTGGMTGGHNVEPTIGGNERHKLEGLTGVTNSDFARDNEKYGGGKALTENDTTPTNLPTGTYRGYEETGATVGGMTGGNNESSTIGSNETHHLEGLTGVTNTNYERDNEMYGGGSANTTEELNKKEKIMYGYGPRSGISESVFEQMIQAYEGDAQVGGGVGVGAGVDEKDVGNKTKTGRMIAIAVDDSKHSEFAFNWALSSLLLPTDTLILLNVRPNTTGSLADALTHKSDSNLSNTPQLASHALLNAYASRLPPGKYNARGVALVGDPAGEICYKMDDLGVDMLVCGTRGLGKLKRAVMGSVSDQLVRNARCAVIVPKMPEGEEGN